MLRLFQGRSLSGTELGCRVIFFFFFLSLSISVSPLEAGRTFDNEYQRTLKILIPLPLVSPAIRATVNFSGRMDQF